MRQRDAKYSRWEIISLVSTVYAPLPGTPPAPPIPMLLLQTDLDRTDSPPTVHRVFQLIGDVSNTVKKIKPSLVLVFPLSTVFFIGRLIVAELAKKKILAF
jgi:hypothetical protein